MRTNPLPTPGEFIFMLIFMIGMVTIGLFVVSAVVEIIQALLSPATWEWVAAATPPFLAGGVAGASMTAVLFTYLEATDAE